MQEKLTFMKTEFSFLVGFIHWTESRLLVGLDFLFCLLWASLDALTVFKQL